MMTITVPSSDLVKKCTTCGEVKPLDEFYWISSAKKRRRAECKACRRAKGRAYYMKHKEERSKYARKWREENAEHVAECGRQYRAENAERIAEYKRRYKVEHAEEVAEHRRQYRIGHREELAEKARQYRLVHPERLKQWRAANRDRLREYNREWHEVNPGARREYERRRRVAKMSGEGSHTFSEFEMLCEEVGWRCLCCGKPHSVSPLTEDHIVPLCSGGDDSIANIQPLCKSCNCKKHMKTIDYWQEGIWATAF